MNREADKDNDDVGSGASHSYYISLSGLFFDTESFHEIYTTVFRKFTQLTYHRHPPISHPIKRIETRMTGLLVGQRRTGLGPLIIYIEE